MDLWVDARMINSSGIGTVLKNVISRLEFFKVHLILRSKDKEWFGYPHRICDAPIYSLQEQWLLTQQIPSCDLFWSPHYNVPVFPLRAKKRAVTIHDACHLAMQDHLTWKQKLYARLMFRQAVLSDLVITDSEFSRSELRRFLGFTGAKVIYPGVDLERFEKQEKAKMDLPEHFLLFVGNVKPHKNLRSLLKVPLPLPLVIVGKKEGLIHSDPIPEGRNIIFTGEINDTELTGIYQRAAALLLPSLYEGFGLPPLEAMAAGCPAIVSNRGSLPEVCREGAAFFDPDDGNSLLLAIQNVLLNRETWIRKGKDWVLQFSWEATAKKHIELFKELVSS